jgi:predicted dehydrogenase
MSNPMRFILIGLGAHGAQWARLTMPRLMASGKAVPVAAVDSNPDRLRHAAEGLGLPPEQLFTDAAEALEKRRADFAIVCTPPMQHERIIDMALTFDVNVLCESPMADTFEGCARIYRKVKAQKRKFAVAMNHRYEPDMQALAMALGRNTYGRPHYMVSRFTHSLKKMLSWGRYRHEMSNPLLVEEGAHFLDLFRMFNNSNAKYVSAAGWNAPWGPYRGDTAALVTMEMENGVHCLFEGSVVNASAMNPGTNHYFRAECEHGTLEVNNHDLRLITGGTLDLPSEQLLPVPSPELTGNVLMANRFCDWIAGGEPLPTNVSDNMRLCGMLFAAIESAHTGKQVDVAQFLHDRMAETRKARQEPKEEDQATWRSLDE